METFFAAFTVIFVMTVIPLFFFGVFKKLNFTLWTKTLHKKIGSIPEEIFVPKNVRNALYPIGFYLIPVFFIGIFFWNHGENSSEPLITNIGRLMTAIPFIYFGILALVWGWWENPFMEQSLKEKKEREELSRQEKIRKISSWIEENKNTSVLIKDYYHFWRAAHIIESLEFCILDKNPAEKLHVDLAANDIESILISPEASAKLLRTTKKIKSNYNRILKKIKKKDLIKQ